MTIAIIGTGNMGGAIMRGLVQSGTCRPEKLICTAKSEATRNKIREYNVSIRVSGDNASSVAEADIIILAVKPRSRATDSCVGGRRDYFESTGRDGLIFVR